MIQSLKNRWLRFAKINILPQAERIWESIYVLYNEDNRHYHNLVHIHDCLEKLDSWPAGIPQKNAVELAIWFHDVIYDSKRADNEESSAALTTHFLRGHPLEVHVCALILATRHKETKGMRAEEVLCDIDLSILGAITEGKYTNYAKNIRQEYAWAPDDKYCEARARVLGNFLKREELYQTAYAKGRWGEQAIINIKEEREILLSGQTL